MTVTYVFITNLHLMFVNVHENVASKLCFCRRRCYNTQYCPSVMCVIYLLFAYFRPERYEFA